MKSRQRNGNIELLRFAFAISIVFFHAGIACDGGHLGVEFFLIVTGYFLGKKIYSKRASEVSWEGAFRESSLDLLKRYKSIFPYLFLSTLIGFTVQCIVYYRTPGAVLTAMEYLVGDFLLVQNFFFPVQSATGVVWYLGAMLFAIWLLYPLMRRHWHAFLYAAPVITCAITGILLNQCGSLNAPDEQLFGWVNSGFLRAVSAISAGVFLFALNHFLHEDMTQDHLSFRGRCAVTILEIFLYLYVFYHMYAFTDGYGLADGTALFAMCVAFLCTVSGESFLYGRFDNAFCRFLGHFTMPLFLNHYYWVRNMGALFDLLGIPHSGVVTYGTAFLLSFVTSALVLIFGKQIKKIRLAGLFL